MRRASSSRKPFFLRLLCESASDAELMQVDAPNAGASTQVFAGQFPIVTLTAFVTPNPEVPDVTHCSVNAAHSSAGSFGTGVE